MAVLVGSGAVERPKRASGSMAAFNGLTIDTGLGATATSALQRDANALQLVFSSFTEGLSQSEYAQEILTTAYSSSAVTDLIGVDALLEKSTAGFPGNLGPRAAAAWRTLQNDAAIRRYNSAVMLAAQTGLRGGPPPYAKNISANAVVFRGLIRKVSALTALVLGASADLRTTAATDETAVTHSLLRGTGPPGSPRRPRRRCRSVGGGRDQPSAGRHRRSRRCRA